MPGLSDKIFAGALLAGLPGVLPDYMNRRRKPDLVP